MDLKQELEKKEKRWKFLNELRKRGVELPSGQIPRLAWEIMKIRLELHGERKRMNRDWKIDLILDSDLD